MSEQRNTNVTELKPKPVINTRPGAHCFTCDVIVSS